MLTASSFVGEAERFPESVNAAQVLDHLEGRFRSSGATHFLATGLPLPGRPVEPLLLRLNWADLRGDRLHLGQLDPHDPLFRPGLSAAGAVIQSEEKLAPGLAKSPLLSMIDSGGRLGLAVVTVNAFLPYQACVAAAGAGLAIEAAAAPALNDFCTAAFGQLFALGAVKTDRPGDLSARERRVVELSAIGKTASEIARMLEISQRTVHAHLQNASEKLRASNKTQTVVEALRHGQISV